MLMGITLTQMSRAQPTAFWFYLRSSPQEGKHVLYDKSAQESMFEALRGPRGEHLLPCWKDTASNYLINYYLSSYKCISQTQSKKFLYAVDSSQPRTHH